MTFFTPQNIFDILSVAAFIGVLLGAITFYWKTTDIKLLRQDNVDLRQSVDDKAKKIVELQTEVTMLTERVKTLEVKNSDLSILVKEALIMYFTRNPSVAKKLQDDE